MTNGLANIRSKILSVLKKYPVRKAALFGSYAKGQTKKSSDVDIILEFNGKRSLLDLVSVKQDLEDLLKKDVDIITYKSIHSLLRKSILENQVVLIC